MSKKRTDKVIPNVVDKRDKINKIIWNSFKSRIKWKTKKRSYR